MGFRIKLAKHVSIGKSGARVDGKIAPGTYVSTGSSGTYVGAKSGPVVYNEFIRNQPATPKSAGRRAASTDDEARMQPIPTAADPWPAAPDMVAAERVRPAHRNHRSYALRRRRLVRRVSAH